MITERFEVRCLVGRPKIEYATVAQRRLQRYRKPSHKHRGFESLPWLQFESRNIQGNRAIKEGIAQYMSQLRKYDEDGRGLCQSEFLDVQCDGHDDHYGGMEWPHFAKIDGRVVTWTEKEEVPAPLMNGICFKF